MKPLFILIFSFQSLFSQKYFIPVDGGFQHVDSGNKYHRVILPETDSIRIYNLLDTQLRKVFRGSNFEFMEKIENKSIKVKGNIPQVIGNTYNYTFMVEFIVRKGYYQYEFTHLNLISNETIRGKPKQLLIQTSSKVIKEEKHINYLLRKKNRPNPIFLGSYHDLINYTDILCDGFDISHQI